MTLIHASGTPARGRSEDSTALQKRLLQDLERQWLDSWGQADQAQAQAAAPDDKPAPESEVAASFENPAITKPQPPSPHRMSGAGPTTRETRTTDIAPDGKGGSASTSTRSAPATHELDGPGRATSDAKPQATPAPGLSPQLGGVQARVGSKEARAEDEHLGRAGLATPESIGRTGASARDRGLQANAVRAAAGGWAAATRAAVDPEAATATSAGTVLVEDKPLATAALPPRRSPSSEETQEGRKEASRASRSHPPPSSAVLKLAPQHLMLREISEQQVLASMRDAELGSHGSRLAAQGLARALMQAGYARVHVVVNGQQQSQDGSAEPDGVARGVSLRSDSKAFESTTNPPIGHGKQR